MQMSSWSRGKPGHGGHHTGHSWMWNVLQSSKLSTPAREGGCWVFIGQALVMDYYGHSHKDAKASARVTTGGATTRNELGWKRVSFKRKWVTAVTTKTKLVLVPKNLTCCFSCPEHPSQMMGSKYSLFSFGGVEETHRMGVSAKGQGIVVNENV